MSKQRKKKAAGGDPYRRGYSNGVTAAVDALLDDLNEAGKLGWLQYDDDGFAVSCNGCVLAHEGFERLATRWQFAVGIKGHDGGSPEQAGTP